MKRIIVLMAAGLLGMATGPAIAQDDAVSMSELLRLIGVWVRSLLSCLQPPSVLGLRSDVAVLTVSVKGEKGART